MISTCWKKKKKRKKRKRGKYLSEKRNFSNKDRKRDTHWMALGLDIKKKCENQQLKFITFMVCTFWTKIHVKGNYTFLFGPSKMYLDLNREISLIVFFERWAH